MKRIPNYRLLIFLSLFVVLPYAIGCEDLLAEEEEEETTNDDDTAANDDDVTVVDDDDIMADDDDTGPPSDTGDPLPLPFEFGPLSITSYDWYNDSWRVRSREEFSYDDSGRLIEIISSSAEGGAPGGWEPRGSQEIHYDGGRIEYSIDFPIDDGLREDATSMGLFTWTEGQVTSISSVLNPWFDGVWEGDFVGGTSYTWSGGQLIESNMSVMGSWYDVFFSYDEFGRCNRTESEINDPVDGMYTSTAVYTYDARGRLIDLGGGFPLSYQGGGRIYEREAGNQVWVHEWAGGRLATRTEYQLQGGERMPRYRDEFQWTDEGSSEYWEQHPERPREWMIEIYGEWRVVELP